MSARKVSRHTRQRRVIRRVFQQAARPLSPREVLALASRQVPGLGLATVYRTIHVFLREGFLTTVPLPGQPHRYEQAGLAHHHHFRCRRCDRVFDIPGCSWQAGSSLPRGFRLEAHEVWLTGLCRSCAR